MAQIINGKIYGKCGDDSYFVQNGKQMKRKAHNKPNKRKSKAQFKRMMQFQTKVQLWTVMRQMEELFFEGGQTSAHRQFIAANNTLKGVYLPKYMIDNRTALLQPGIVVSDGPLPSFDYQLGELDGQPALLTTLAEADAHEGRLLLYVFHQEEKRGIPFVKAKVTDLSQPTDEVNLTTLDGSLALTGKQFGDPMNGFALVHIVKGHTSRQSLVTSCTQYEQYTTEEALLASANSYGKVINQGFEWVVTIRKNRT